MPVSDLYKKKEKELCTSVSSKMTSLAPRASAPWYFSVLISSPVMDEEAGLIASSDALIVL